MFLKNYLSGQCIDIDSVLGSSPYKSTVAHTLLGLVSSSRSFPAIFVCGQRPKDLEITWVVLDTLLIYFWGELLGYTYGGALLGAPFSGLNLAADLGPVLPLLN